MSHLPAAEQPATALSPPPVPPTTPMPASTVPPNTVPPSTVPPSTVPPSTVPAAAGSTAVDTRSSSETSIAALIRQLSEESSRLIRNELRLAQAEMTEKAKRAGSGLGALGVAGVLAWFGLGCLLATLILLLSVVLPGWLAALIVTVVVLIAAGIAGLIGRRQVRAAGPVVPTETVASVKADVAEIKESVRR